MTKDEQHQLIIELVSNKPGIKGTELVTEVVSAYYKSELVSPTGSDETTIESINHLVKKGELVEVEYVLPTMTYRVKSLYFPKGTEILPRTSAAVDYATDEGTAGSVKLDAGTSVNVISRGH